MAIDPYQADIPAPARKDMPVDSFETPAERIDSEGTRGVVTTWVLLALLGVMFIGALYVFAPDRSTTSPAVRADSGAMAQQKDPSPH